MKGFLAFVLGVAVVCPLTLIPPDEARWIALSLLVLVALTPAVGQSKPGRRPAKPRRERGA